jgi:hypothetical protein
VQLEAEKVDSAGKHLGIATELGQARIDGDELLSSLGNLFQIGSGEPVERLALRGLVQQGLMNVLAVQVDKAVTDL